MNTIEYINSLSPEAKAEEYEKAKRAAVKNILTFIAIKASLYLTIAYLAKKARDLA